MSYDKKRPPEDLDRPLEEDVLNDTATDADRDVQSDVDLEPVGDEDIGDEQDTVRSI